MNLKEYIRQGKSAADITLLLGNTQAFIALVNQLAALFANIPAETDYSGKEKELQIHQDAFTKEDKVLIIDDWVETGETIKTAIKLIEKAGGKIIGIGVSIDDSNQDLKFLLEKYNYRFLERTKHGDNF